MDKILLINLSGFKSASTWLSSIFSSENQNNLNYFSPCYSKFYPFPDLRFHHNGFQNIPKYRLESIKMNSIEDKIFLDNLTKHRFSEIGSPKKTALRLVDLLRPYLSKSIYLGDPNNHYLLSNYLAYLQKSSKGKSAQSEYFQTLEEIPLKIKFFFVLRPFQQQLKSFMKMHFGDPQQASFTNNQIDFYDFLTSDVKMEDKLNELKHHSSLLISRTCSLFNLLNIGDINYNIDIFNFNSIKSHPDLFLRNFLDEYNISRDQTYFNLPNNPNPSITYADDYSKIIDTLAERLIEELQADSKKIQRVMKIESHLFEKLKNKEPGIPIRVSL